MIVNSHTIIDPWTMVVKSFHTLVANAAMSVSISPYDFAVRTEEYRVK
jgi:hypothetical protein